MRSKSRLNLFVEAWVLVCDDARRKQRSKWAYRRTEVFGSERWTNKALFKQVT